MKKKILVGSLVVASLALGACSSKESVNTSRTETVAQTAKAESKVEVEKTEAESSKEVEASEETTNEEVEVESVDETAENIESESTEMDTSFLNESVAPADRKDSGKQDVTLAATSDLIETPEIMGYKMKALRPFDYYASDGTITDYADILSGEYWSGNAIFHTHTNLEGDTTPGYFYDHPHDGPCYIEESIQVQIYPAEFQDVGWTYEEGEDLSDWLDDQACTMITGDGSNIEKVEYSVNGRDWTVYYGQTSLNKDPKDDFSTIYCDGYFKDENGDYVVVELQHKNLPTLKTDNHVPSAEERMQTAKQEYETIMSTFEKVSQ